MEVEEFCKSLPKIELHAHLNGSLSEATLKSLGCLDENISEYSSLSRLLNTTEKTLNECFELFKVAQNATNNVESVYEATKSVIQDFHRENVIYAEIRTTPRSEPNMTKAEYIESVIKAILDNTLPILVKLILSIDRRHDLQTSFESMSLFIKMKNKYPEIIKGVDLSGNPAVGSFHKSLFEVASANGLFTAIHCAEVKNHKEVKQILEFNPNRLGHGTFLHPNYGGSKENWDLYLQRKIPVECCLTSNVICGTSKSYKEHHVQEWIKEGLPFSLNTDDKGVFCSDLSNEFILFANAFNCSFQDLWKISYNSIDHSFASDEEKTRLKKHLQDWKLNRNF